MRSHQESLHVRRDASVFFVKAFDDDLGEGEAGIPLDVGELRPERVAAVEPAKHIYWWKQISLGLVRQRWEPVSGHRRREGIQLLPGHYSPWPRLVWLMHLKGVCGIQGRAREEVPAFFQPEHVNQRRNGSQKAYENSLDM